MNLSMKRMILLVLALLTHRVGFAQYQPADEGSALKFTISNLGFDVKGTFSGLAGKINFDAQNPSAASFDVTLNAGSVNTDNSLRDEHLKAGGYFDVTNYPHIRLASTAIKSTGKNRYEFTGKLTIKNTTKDISFPFTATTETDGYLFTGSFKINRKDYGVGGTSTIANELQVDMSIRAKKVSS